MSNPYNSGINETAPHERIAFPDPDSVGANAGKIWNYLRENGKTSVIKLKSGVQCSAGELHLSLGWLLREGKITLSLEKGQLAAGLKK